MSERREGLYCVNHPDTETVLRCGRCERPICVRCTYQTPVGARCRECARLRRLPQYQVSGVYLARAVGAGLLLAGASALVWWLALPLGGFFSLLIGAGIGYLVGEGVSRSANRKRGPVMESIAGFSVAAGFLLASLIVGHFFLDIFRLASVALAVYMAVMRLR